MGCRTPSQEGIIRAPTLLRYRLRSLSRRAAAGSLLTRAVVVAVVALAVLGTWLGMDALAATDRAATGGLPGGLELIVRERVFWLTTLMVVVFAYSTFEVFFRAGDRRFVASLPIPGRARYVDLLTRALVLHVPLVVPPLLYGVALWLEGATEVAWYAVAMTSVVYLVGIPLCVWIHLLAGRSLLGGGSQFKRLLAGGVIADEAALLVYAPAGGLLATLLLGLITELMLRDALIRGQAERLMPLLGGAAALTLFSVLKGRALADRFLHVILPRFSELDVPPPFRDDGVKRTIGGARLATLLPAPARPYFMRDLTQLRRRFRLDRVLLWVYAAALLRLNLASPDGASVEANLIALGLANGLFFASAFRLHGGELASPWIARSFPIDSRAHWQARLAVDAIYPAWTLLLTVACVLASGQFVRAAIVAGLGAALVVTLVSLSQLLAARAFPERVFAAASIWRGTIIAIAGVVLWQVG